MLVKALDRVRIIMAAFALILLVGLFILLFLQQKWHEDNRHRPVELGVPALGPKSDRPKLEPIPGLETVQGPAYINFWASWCEPCIKELPLIDQLITKPLLTKKLQVLLVNMDQADQMDSAQKIALQLAPKTPQVYLSSKIEANNTGLQKFGIKGIPYHLVIDENNQVAAAFYAPLETEFEALIKLLEELLNE